MIDSFEFGRGIPSPTEGTESALESASTFELDGQNPLSRPGRLQGESKCHRSATDPTLAHREEKTSSEEFLDRHDAIVPSRSTR